MRARWSFVVESRKLRYYQTARAIRVEYVRAVVPGVIVPLARSAIVHATGGESRSVEPVNRIPVARTESDVDPATRRAVVAEEQLQDLERVLVLPGDRMAEGPDRGCVEASASREITYTQMDVVEEKSGLVAHVLSEGAGGARLARSGSRA